MINAMALHSSRNNTKLPQIIIIYKVYSRTHTHTPRPSHISSITIYDRECVRFRSYQSLCIIIGISFFLRDCNNFVDITSIYVYHIFAYDNFTSDININYTESRLVPDKTVLSRVLPLFNKPVR